MKKLYASLSALLFACSAQAAASMATPVNVSVFSSDTCAQNWNKTAPFILALKPNEDVNQSIIDCANAMNLPGAAVMGVGTIKNPLLHYYDQNTKQNGKLYLDGSYELASLNGNIDIQDGKRVVHLHAVLGDEKGNAIAGHLDDGTVTALTEVTIIPMQGEVIRQYDPKTGFESLVAPTTH